MDAPAVRPPGGDDHPNRRRHPHADIPATFPRDLVGQSPLSIDRADQLVDVGDLGLQLDHEQSSPGRMPRQDVDDPALAVNRKRDLRFGQPAGQPRETPGDLLVQGRVAGVQQPVQVAAAPAGHEIDTNIERLRDGPDARQAHRVEMATLHA
jgi:hypothetical protein